MFDHEPYLLKTFTWLLCHLSKLYTPFTVWNVTGNIATRYKCKIYNEVQYYMH